MPSAAKLVLIGGALLISAAVGAQLFGPASQRTVMDTPDLATLLPAAIEGWTVDDRPVAESPELVKAVEDTLDYDAALFRTYRRGGLEISVYMAYWLPGKVPSNAVDAHTPDICWVANGWRMEKLPPTSTPTANYGEFPVPNVRRFEISGGALSVVYWHLNGAELRQNDSVYEIALTVSQRARRRIGQFKNIVFNPPREQLFVRVASNQSITEQFCEKPVQACLDLLARMMGGERLFVESATLTD